MSTENDSERMLDKTLADTFPASDPLSTLPNPRFDSFEPEEDSHDGEELKHHPQPAVRSH